MRLRTYAGSFGLGLVLVASACSTDDGSPPTVPERLSIDESGSVKVLRLTPLKDVETVGEESWGTLGLDEASGCLTIEFSLVGNALLVISSEAEVSLAADGALTSEQFTIRLNEDIPYSASFRVNGLEKFCDGGPTRIAETEVGAWSKRPD